MGLCRRYFRSVARSHAHAARGRIAGRISLRALHPAKRGSQELFQSGHWVAHGIGYHELKVDVKAASFNGVLC